MSLDQTLASLSFLPPSPPFPTSLPSCFPFSFSPLSHPSKSFPFVLSIPFYLFPPSESLCPFSLPPLEGEGEGEGEGEKSNNGQQLQVSYPTPDLSLSPPFYLSPPSASKYNILSPSSSSPSLITLTSYFHLK